MGSFCGNPPGVCFTKRACLVSFMAVIKTSPMNLAPIKPLVLSGRYDCSRDGIPLPNRAPMARVARHRYMFM